MWHFIPGVIAMMGILLKGQPSNVQALILRGKSYFYIDDLDMAKRHFGEALKHDPDHQQAKAQFSKVRSLHKKKSQVGLSPNLLPCATPSPHHPYPSPYTSQSEETFRKLQNIG